MFICLESPVFKVINLQNLMIVWYFGGSQLVYSEIDKVLDVEDAIYTDLKGMIELHSPATDEEKVLSKELAEMVGCSESTVNNFMTRYNKRVS